MDKRSVIKKINEATEFVLNTEPQSRKVKASQAIAFSGVFCALALVIMLLTSLLGIFTYAGPITAAAALIPIREEFGTKTGICTWAAISLLSLMLLPDREMALFFLCFGWFPLALRSLHKIKPRALRIVLTLGIYLVLIALMYGLLCRLMGIDPELAENTLSLNIALLAAGGLTFLLCDAAYCRLTLFWQMKWRKTFKRML
ncbi:MAG: hypothetical protein MJ194_00795 [Clostridia bacterium]|nr:hypothetical protein [Clostridia bacterium]